MFFRQILDPDLGCACYVFGCGGNAIVVDPGLRVERILDVLAEEKAQARTIIETHVHADHVSGRALLAERTGADVRVPAGGGVDPFAGEPLAGGDEVWVGKVRVEALAAPGHRPEHLALLLTDTGRSEEPWALLSGDSLLVGDLARPDLAVDAAEGAADLHATLARLTGLPDHVELWPGHTGGSLCGGAGLSPKASSTLGFERRAQRLLAVDDVAEFTRTLTASLPNRPPTVEHVVELNRSLTPGHAHAHAAGRAPASDPAAAHYRAPLETTMWGAEAASLRTGRFARRETVIVDGRPAEAFDAGHLAGAISLPLSGNGIGTRAGWVIDPEADIVVTAATGTEAIELAQRLRAVGLDRVRNVLPWGALRAGELGYAASISIRDLPMHLTDMVLVDVRDESEWDAGHVADSINLPLSRLRDGTATLPRERLAVACAVGGRAAFAASWMRRSGHDALRVSGGGIPDLLELGVPLVS